MVVINRRCILLAVINEYYLLGPMLMISPKILEEGSLDPANDKKEESAKPQASSNA